MAKKKAESKSETPAAKKPAAKAPAKKSNPAPAGMPFIDTSLAASIAAKFVANRGKLQQAKRDQANTTEDSNSFKDFKEGINNPKSTLGGDVLNNFVGQKPSNLPAGGKKEVAHNQSTFANFNKAGVPRRTPG